VRITAIFSDSSNAIESRATRMSEGWAARMVQFGTVLILAFSLLNVVECSSPRWTWGLGCAWLSVLLSVVCLSLTFTRWFTRNWRPLMFFVVAAITISHTLLALFGHQDSRLFVFALLLLMVGTGSILPWPTRYQVAFNLLCLTSYAAHLSRFPGVGGNEPYEIAGIIIAAALSWFSCDARERFVKRHEESERIIRESERTSRQMFDANTDGIALTDLETRRIVDVNESFLRVSGYRREEIIGKTSDELQLWTDAEIEAEYYRRVRDRDQIENMEVTFRGKDGILIPSLLSSTFVTLHGRACLMTLARDISHLRAAEQKIRQSEATLRKIFDSSLDLMAITDVATGNYLDINESFARAIGYSREELVGSNFFKLQIWPIEEEWQPFIEELMAKGEVRNRHATFRCKDGRLFDALVSAVECELWASCARSRPRATSAN
jgi:PAS domain S-box-containing protein